MECRRLTENNWTLVAENCHRLSHEINDLEPGESYIFRVRALNLYGSSEPTRESLPYRVPVPNMDESEDMLNDEEDGSYLEDGKLNFCYFIILEMNNLIIKYMF